MLSSKFLNFFDRPPDGWRIADTADPPRPPPLPECAPALRFPASPSPQLASTTRAFYPPNRYSRTPRTAAPVSTLRLLTSWLLLTYPVASDLQRGGLCSREMLIVEPLQLQTSSECSFW